MTKYHERNSLDSINLLSQSSEAGIPRSRYEQDHAPLKALEKDLFQASLLTYGSFSSCGSITASHGILPLCMSVFKFPLFKESCHTGLGVHSTPV